MCANHYINLKRSRTIAIRNYSRISKYIFKDFKVTQNKLTVVDSSSLILVIVKIKYTQNSYIKQIEGLDIFNGKSTYLIK